MYIERTERSVYIFLFLLFFLNFWGQCKAVYRGDKGDADADVDIDVDKEEDTGGTGKEWQM